MMSQALISKIHCTLSANQKRDSQLNVLIIITFMGDTFVKHRLAIRTISRNGKLLSQL